MPPTPPPDNDEPDHRGPGAARPGCGDHCRCPRGRQTSDLDTLLATPGFAGSLLGSDITSVTGRMPSLDQVVGVTVAGPVLMNDVGIHDTPIPMGGPIRCSPGRITLRLNPARLGEALVTEPAAHVPPTLRLFDSAGNTAHATYLTEHSDRLAFESLTLRSGDEQTDTPPLPDPELGAFPGLSGTPEIHANDQVAQFDSILDDGGALRRAAFGSGAGEATRVEMRRIISAFEHVALLGMPVTTATAAPGCLQMRHDRLDGAREHRGSMVIASGSCRTMINFNLVADCWVTWSDGVWGRTGSMELYDRHGRCSFVATQTGAVEANSHAAWHQLMCDLVG